MGCGDCRREHSQIERRVESVFDSVASIFQVWVNCRKAEHTIDTEFELVD